MSTTSKRLGVARLLDYSWELIQFANVYKDAGKSCMGILWDIDADELVLLDIREGYPTFYDRTVTEVNYNGESKQAIVYVMTEEYRKDLSNRRPSKGYVDGVTEGFAEDGLIVQA
jgi:gamma-glutamylcyclotransferase (GGCT)/AIG2-like uncharacterized protein YtfP